MNSKTKKIAVIIGLVLAVAVCVPLGRFLIQKVKALPNSILSFSPATRTVGNNQSFTLDAMIDPRTNQVTAVEVHVTYDQTRFRLDSISNSGSPFSVVLQAASINNTNGTASIVVGIPAASPLVPVTTLSRVATFSFTSLAAVTSSPFAFAATSMAAALDETGNVLTQRDPAAVTVDAAAPTGGSISYTNGYFNVTSVALTVNDGTDPVSGINTASRIVRRRLATLTGTTCGTYGSWGTISPTGTYPNLIDAAVSNGNCYQYQYLVSDNAGNQATYTGSDTARIDTTAPTLAQVTAVPSPTNNTTPGYTFSSTEAGTIAYGGNCSSATTAATAGNNTVTFNTLASAVHSNCTIRVTDAAGNQSSVLNVNSFTVDAIPPVISAVSPAANTSINSITSANGGSDVSYTLSETVQSGSIVFTRTSGTADASSPRTCALRGTALNSGAHNNLNLADTTNACAVAQSLVNGTVYTMTINATDAAGNAAAQISNSGITLDTTAPTLAQVTAVPNPTNSTTPGYTFSSTEAGTIAYGGSCSSSAAAAASGNNTITFNTLAAGTYNNCTVAVTDAAGNASSALSVNSFTIDTAAPTITNVTSTTANGTYNAGANINITVNFSEAVTSTGNVTVNLDTGRNCSFAVANSTSGSCTYAVQNGDTSADLTTTSISGTIRDQAGNTLTNFTPAVNLGANKNIVISAVLPILSQITAVPNISSNTTPSYTFSTSLAGTITYNGGCSSAVTAATAGNNTITFNALAVGNYANCTVTVTDALGNASAPLNVNTFAVTYPGDFDLSRAVNIFDYNILITNFGNSSCGNAADADKNCRVDIFDYNIFLGDYGRSF